MVFFVIVFDEKLDKLVEFMKEVIKEVVVDFKCVVYCVKEVGFDVIEIYVVYGYLIY